MKIKIASIKELLWFNGCIFRDINHVRNNRNNIWLIEGLKVLTQNNIKLCNHSRLHKRVIARRRTHNDRQND